MKKVAILASLLFAVLVMVAPTFAQSEDRDYDSLTPEDLSGVEVTFWHQHTGFRETQLNALIAVFNNPDITDDELITASGYAGTEESERQTLIDIANRVRDIAREYNPYGIVVVPSNQGGYSDIFNKVTTALAAGGGDLPALVVAYQNQAATYEVVDGLIDMNPLVNSPVWGLSEEDQADFFPGFFSADIFPTFDNERLGFPPNRSMEVMYYNQDWLDELYANGAISFEGAPQTPEQFREATCAATANPFSGATGENASIGYQLSMDASRFASWTFAFGGDIFDDEAGQYSLDSEAAVSAMEFLKSLFDEGCAGEIFEDFGDQTNFGAGTTLFTVGSSSGLPYYRSAVEDGAGFNWSVAPLPHTTDEPVMNIYGASVSIPVTTPVEELAAWIFVKYYTDATVNAIWAEASNYFPVRQSSADSLGDVFAALPAYETAFSLLPFGTAEPPVPGYDPVRVEMANTMNAIVTGTAEGDVPTVLAELNAFGNEELDAASMGN